MEQAEARRKWEQEVADRKRKWEQEEADRKRDDARGDFLPMMGGFAVIASVLGAFAEVYRWLQSGVWAPYDSWAIGRGFFDQSWLAVPESWVGIHLIVVWCLDMPLFIGLTLFVFGGCGVVFYLLFFVFLEPIHHRYFLPNSWTRRPR